jgi:hypothetical protein
VFDRATEADFAGFEHDGHESIEDGHGWHEERYVTVIYDPEGLPPGWPEVAAVVVVRQKRVVNGRRTDTAHYYITSLRATAADLGGLPPALVGREPPVRRPARRQLVRRRTGPLP